MNKSLQKKGIEIPKIALFVLGEIFAVISLVMSVSGGDWTRIALSAVTMIFVPLPLVFEQLFKKKLTIPTYIIGFTYTLGPMLGHTYNFYYMLPGWDKFLHFTAGIVFAMIGFELAFKLCKGKASEVNYWLIAIFGLCFSMAVSVSWEFVEYGLDMMLGIDTQSDTVVHSIYSLYLTTEAGMSDTITNINEVMIDGKPLGVGGYLDIGLHDTMRDLIVESLGAWISIIPIVVRKGRHTVFRRQEQQS